MVKNFLEFEIWKRKRAEGVILTYLQGKKVSLDWVLGCLKGYFGLSRGETISIIKKIKENPKLYLLDKDPARKIRLKRIESKLSKWKEFPSAIIPSVKAYK